MPVFEIRFQVIQGESDPYPCHGETRLHATSAAEAKAIFEVRMAGQPASYVVGSVEEVPEDGANLYAREETPCTAENH